MQASGFASVAVRVFARQKRKILHDLLVRRLLDSKHSLTCEVWEAPLVDCCPLLLWVVTFDLSDQKANLSSAA